MLEGLNLKGPLCFCQSKFTRMNQIVVEVLIDGCCCGGALSSLRKSLRKLSCQ